MTPYYRDDAVTLYCGDWRTVLPVVHGYDHVIMDPPYDQKTHTGARSELRKKYGVHFDALPSVHEVALGVLPGRWALAFCALEMLGAYQHAAQAQWVRAGVWDRTDGAPQLSGDRPAQAVEGIAIWHAAHVGHMRWNGGGKRAVWRCGVVRGEDRVHETQKPLALLRALVLDFTDPGELILDPFAGSGTTGVAAKECGRRAVLIEINEEHCKKAAARLAEAVLDERVARVAGAKVKQQALEL